MSAVTVRIAAAQNYEAVVAGIDDWWGRSARPEDQGPAGGPR